LAKSNFIVRGGADFSGITKGFNKLNKQVKGFQLNFGKVAKGLGLALSGIAITQFIKDSTKVAMSVESAMDNISRNMKSSALVFDDWVKTQSKAFGMAKSDAYNYGSTFSNLLGSFITDAKETATQTQELMKAAAIIASKTGRTYDDVANRIRSGMLGSTEAIEDLGVYTNISMIESTEAFKKFANGKSWSKLNFQTQQQIRLAAILEQTYKRYGKTLADTTQTRHAQFIATLQNIKLNLGQAFLPIYNYVLPALTSLASKIEYITNVFAQFTQALFGKATGIKVIEDKTEAIGDYGNAIEEAGKQSKKALGPFDEINKLTFGEGISLGGIGSAIKTELNDLDNGTGGKLGEIGSKAQEMANKVKEALGVMQPFFEGFKDVFSEFWAKIKEFNETKLAKWLGDIGDWMRNNPDTLEKLGRGLGYVAIGLAGFKTLKFLSDITGVSKLVGKLIDLKKATGDVNKGFGEKNDLLGKQTKQTTADTVATLGLTAGILGLLGGVKQLGKYMEENPLKIPPLQVPSLQPVYSMLDEMNNKYSATTTTVESNLATHKNNVGIIAAGIAAVLSANIANGLLTTGNNTNNALTSIQDNFQKFGQNIGILSAASSIALAKNLGEGFVTSSKNFISFANELSRNMITLGSGLAKASAETAKTFASNMVSGFKTVWDNFKSLMSGIGEKVSGWFKENKDVIVKTTIAAGVVIGATALALAVPATIPYITGGLAGLAAMPALKKGGITGVNDPFAAIVGDNRTQREVISPLDDLLGMIESTVNRAVGNNQGGDMTVVVKIGEDTITEKLISNINRQNRISGKTVIQV